MVFSNQEKNERACFQILGLIIVLTSWRSGEVTEKDGQKDRKHFEISTCQSKARTSWESGTLMEGVYIIFWHFLDWRV